uniref:Putative ovule protein n=1 Tax=Solanum chacoense TaxID=4108 RepID=A0A0V0HJ27_SOLCH
MENVTCLLILLPLKNNSIQFPDFKLLTKLYSPSHRHYIYIILCHLFSFGTSINWVCGLMIFDYL